MRRDEFCKLIGMSVARFKKLAERDQLPFRLPVGDDPQRQYRTYYTGHAALCILLQDDLTRDGGLSLKLAAELIRKNSDALWRRLCEDDVEKQFWIGCIQFSTEPSKRRGKGSKKALPNLMPLVGTTDEIAKRMLMHTDTAATLHNASGARVFIANASIAMGTILARAEAAKINLFGEATGDR